MSSAPVPVGAPRGPAARPTPRGGAVGRRAGRLGLRKRVYLLMAVGIFFPLALMAAAGISWLRDLDERLLSVRLESARAVAAHFDEELTGDLEVLQRLASASSSGFGDANLSDERRAVSEAHRHLRNRESVFILDGERNVLAEEPAGMQSAAPSAELPLADEVLRAGVPRLSGLVLSERGPVVHELVPIRSWQGQVVGIAGGTFDPSRRAFDRMLQHLRQGLTGSAEIVDAGGLVVASTRPGRAGHAVECGAHLAGLIRNRRIENARCDGCHADLAVKARAPADLATFVPLASAPWGVLVRQSVEEALPTEGAAPWYVATILLVQLGLTGAFAWGAARSITRPLAVLTVEAERIAGGELAWPIPDLGSDEVGRLGKSLDTMRDNLRQLIEHVAEANQQLEQRVVDRTKELGEVNAQLREREVARSDLLRKVITAQEDERKRIARELHDETSQSLAVLAMGVEGAQEAIRAGRTPRLDEVKAVAVRTLEEVHRLILDLRPSVLDDLGLLSAIRWYADRHLESRGVSVRTEFGELNRLPPEMETALFRICQETMSNVARHAQATRVLVQVGLEGDRIHIEIEDDGKGFDPAEAVRREKRRSWGLMGIRERAEILGGTAKIDSSPGQGTRVQVWVPLPRPLEPVRADEPPATLERAKQGEQA